MGAALKRPYEERWQVEQLMRSLKRATRGTRKEPSCFTRAEAARRLGVTLAELRGMERLGMLLLTRVGRRCLVPVSELAHLEAA
jgi:hypothetical protein